MSIIRYSVICEVRELPAEEKEQLGKSITTAGIVAGMSALEVGDALQEIGVVTFQEKDGKKLSIFVGNKRTRDTLEAFCALNTERSPQAPPKPSFRWPEA